MSQEDFEPWQRRLRLKLQEGPGVKLQVEAHLSQVSDTLERTGERAERRGDVTVREGGLSTVCSGAQAESPGSSLGLGDACSELAH